MKKSSKRISTIKKVTNMAAITLLFTGVFALSLEQRIIAAQTETSTSALEVEGLFTERDLANNPDLSEATTLTLTDGEDTLITEEGVYVLQGSSREATIIVEAGSEDKVQLVLDGVQMTNETFPCIYVKEADKVFVTTTADSSLSVTGTFEADGDVNTDATIFSRDDLTLNGTATLRVSSTDNAIVSKDDLKITGGTYQLEATSKTLSANDSIRIADGTFTLTAGTDCLHAENDDDDTLGYIYLGSGHFTLKAGDDGIHATSIVQIDGGTFDITAGEGIEATQIQINEGTIAISASDDGINAAQKSSSYFPSLEINGGNLTIVMASGDTDGLDSNGNLTINGGTIDITAASPVDYDGNGQYNGGTLILNGSQVTSLPTQMMGGRAMGGWGNQNGQMNGQGTQDGQMNGRGMWGGGHRR